MNLTFFFQIICIQTNMSDLSKYHRTCLSRYFFGQNINYSDEWILLYQTVACNPASLNMPSPTVLLTYLHLAKKISYMNSWTRFIVLAGEVILMFRICVTYVLAPAVFFFESYNVKLQSTIAYISGCKLLWCWIVLKYISKNQNEKFPPYDLFCPSLNEKWGSRICKTGKINFASIVTTFHVFLKYDHYSTHRFTNVIRIYGYYRLNETLSV